MANKICVGWVVVLSFLLTACFGLPNNEQTLTIYAGLHQDHAIKAIETFEKETGIQVRHVLMSSGEILVRVRGEKKNPQASVWFGGPADAIVQAKEEGLLEPYVSPNAKDIPKQYKDSEGYWTGIYVGSVAFVSNKRWLQETGLKAPESWDDLLLPEFRGMIVLPDPRSSGTGYTILATLVQLMGEDEAFDYLQKLDEQVWSYTTSGLSPGRSVGMGHTGMSIIFSHDAFKHYREGYNEILITFPQEGTGYEVGGVAVLRDAPQKDAAQAFVDWALTKHAQEVGKQIGSYQLLTNEHAVSPEGAFPLESLEVIDYDHEWAGKNRKRLIDRWTKEIGKNEP